MVHVFRYNTRNLFALVWLIGIYLSELYDLRILRRHLILYFILTGVVVNVGLIEVSTVDWDNRFYIPMEPGMIVLAGTGTASIFRWVRDFFGWRFKI